MNIIRNLVAVLAGMLIAMMVVMAIESVSIILYPIPEDARDDPQALRQWAEKLPVLANLIVLIAWCAGAFAGAAITRLVSTRRWIFGGLLVILLLVGMGVFNLVTLPHRWFMWPGMLIGMPVAGLLGMLLVSPKRYFIDSQQVIQAPIEQVFHTIANIENFSQAVPEIKRIEFLTEQKTGKGCRFRETRVMHGKEATTELTITEFEENQSVRYLSDAGGAVWDTVFHIEPKENDTLLVMTMEARPHQFAAKVLTPMILRMISRAVNQDMLAVKSFCESGPR